MQTTVSAREDSETKPSETLPKEVISLEFNPQRRLAHFVLELTNVPGALEKSSTLTTKHRVNILSGFHNAPSAAQKGFWSFFADFTDADLSPAELADEFRALPSTIRARFQVPPNGLLIDSYHFPLSWGGQRAVMMRTDCVNSIFSRIVGIFGDGPAARVVMFEMGEAAGSAIHKELSQQLGPEIIRKELSSLMGLYGACGWGVFELMNVNFDTKTAAVRVKHSFECDHYANRSHVPRAHFVRGHVAGWFSDIFGSRVDVTETACAAMGGEFCEFNIKTYAT